MRSVDSLENSDTGRDWEQEEKVTTGWHHRLDVREQEEKVTAGWQHRLSVSSSELGKPRERPALVSTQPLEQAVLSSTQRASTLISTRVSASPGGHQEVHSSGARAWPLPPLGQGPSSVHLAPAHTRTVSTEGLHWTLITPTACWEDPQLPPVSLCSLLPCLSILPGTTTLKCR